MSVVAVGRRRLLIVIGSGRSGTSVLSSLLRELGVHVPQPEVPADASNPYGFGEPQWLVDFHKRLLAEAEVQPMDGRPQAFALTNAVANMDAHQQAATTWLSQSFGSSSLVVLKDPRLLWFSSLWASVAERLGTELSYVTMLRRPADVVASNQRWYGRSDLSAIGRTAGYVNSMLVAERETRDAPRSWLEFDVLRHDWRGAIAELDAALGLSIFSSASAEALATADQVLDPTRAPTMAKWSELAVPDEVSSLADEVWSCLRSGSEEKPSEQRIRLDDLWSRYCELHRLSEGVSHSVAEARSVREHVAVLRRDARIAELDAAVAGRDARIAELGAAVAGRDARIAELDAAVAGRDARIAELQAAVAEREERLARRWWQGR